MPVIDINTGVAADCQDDQLLSAQFYKILRFAEYNKSTHLVSTDEKVNLLTNDVMHMTHAIQHG